MSDKSKIEWTDATWNPVVGCSLVSPGCTNCYAMRMAARINKMTLASHYEDTTKPSKAGPVWTGKLACAPEWLVTAPLRWRKPRRVFVNSMGDLFHEDTPDEWIDRVFAVMALCPQHTFQVLTKRAARMRAYFEGIAADQALGINRFGVAALATGIKGPGGSMPAWPLPNVWLGVSTERQEEADARIPLLLETPAAKRFISAEPLLGPISLEKIPHAHGWGSALEPGEIHGGTGQCVGARPGLDWVIVGGESGPKARPMHPDWACSLRDQCANAGVPFFFKQWGNWGEPIAGDEGKHLVNPNGTHGLWDSMFPGMHGCVVMSNVGKKTAGRLLDGVEHSEFPA